MHYMHYKDYIHHGLAAEKTTPPLPQGGGTIWLGGGGVWGSLLIYIYTDPIFRDMNLTCCFSPCHFTSQFFWELSPPVSDWAQGPGSPWIRTRRCQVGSTGNRGVPFIGAAAKSVFFFLFSCEFLQHRFFGIFLGSIFEGNAIAKTQRKLC